MLDAILVDDISFFGVAYHWVVRTQFFQCPAVTRLAMIHGTDTEEWAMLATH
jgi:hypothetical protein